MKSLVSLGGQHQGIFGFPNCPGETFDLCNSVRELLTIGAYVEQVQNNVVQAQYWHDPLDFDNYVKHSAFLAEINNERKENFKPEYAENLAKLENLVLVMFAQVRKDTFLKEKFEENRRDRLQLNVIFLLSKKIFLEVQNRIA